MNRPLILFVSIVSVLVCDRPCVRADEAPSPPLHLHWAYRCAGSVQTEPAVHDGTLYFGSMDGVVHAVDARMGEARWRAELGGMLLAAPTVDTARGQLLVGCDDGHVYALALADGKARWKHRTPGEWTVMAGPQVKGRPLLVGDLLYVVNLLGHVEALQAVDGKSVWKTEGFGLAGGTPVLVGDRLLFTCTERGLVCLEAGSGKVAWERKDIGRSVSTPAVAEGVVFVGSPLGSVFAVELANGKDVWRRALEGTSPFGGQVVGPAVVARENVLVADIDGRVFALDRKTGEVRWKAQGLGGFWAGGRLLGQYVWFASTSGQLVAMALERNGDSQWLLDLKAPLWITPIVHDGKLYQGTDDGYLFCLAPGEPKKPRARPPLQTDLRFKYPAPARGELLHEFIGTVSGFKSQPFSGPPRESDLRGKQLHFTFQLKVERAGQGPDGKQAPSGQEIQVVSRPLTNYFDWNCSPTFTGLPVDWAKTPRLRVVGSYEPPVLNPYADAKTQPRPLCAYIIQKEPAPATPIPPAHWPTWYVNNWVHFLCDMYEVGHDRYFSNTGHLNWGWDFVEERTMGQFLPRDVWAQVKPRYYLWRAVNGVRQLRDPRTGLHRCVPTTLTMYLSGARHADPYHSELDLRALPPKLSLQANHKNGKAPLTVKFRAETAGKNVQWVQWTFDAVKGLTADALEREPTHTYEKPGKYLVSLTAVSASGMVSHAHTVIEVVE